MKMISSLMVMYEIQYYLSMSLLSLSRDGCRLSNLIIVSKIKSNIFKVGSLNLCTSRDTKAHE